MTTSNDISTQQEKTLQTKNRTHNKKTLKYWGHFSKKNQRNAPNLYLTDYISSHHN